MKHLFIPYFNLILYFSFITITCLELCFSTEYPKDLVQNKSYGENIFYNKQKAESLIKKLYDRNTGAQHEYLQQPKHSDNYLAKYGRTWSYTAGIALTLATRKKQIKKALAIAEYLLNHLVVFKTKSGKKIIGGWHFSRNTKHDHWSEPRLVTGANAWALDGLGQFITSPIFKNIPISKQNKIIVFYRRFIPQFLINQRKDGLFTAGWTTQELVSAPKNKYYDVLESLGYGGGTFAKARNVVTEHNIDALHVLNHAIKYEKKFGLTKIIKQLTIRRNALQKAIFKYLYNAEEGRFITGRTSTKSGNKPSPHTAIDNATWLALYIDYSTLPPKYLEKIASGLYYTVKHFVKNIKCEGYSYYGCHYFSPSFEDPYISKSKKQEQAYHIEATAGMILGLSAFCDNNPKHRLTPLFRQIAFDLWNNMQVFVSRHGFVYSSVWIRNLLTDLQSCTSAIWYIDVADYFSKIKE